MPPKVKAPMRALSNPPPPPEADRYNTFKDFADLAPEIRHKIWGFSLPEPQTLVLTYDVVRGRGSWRITKAVKLPSIQNTCQESRFISRNHGYELLSLSTDITQRFWFNFDIDTIFLNTNAKPWYPKSRMNESHLSPDYEDSSTWAKIEEEMKKGEADYDMSVPRWSQYGNFGYHNSDYNYYNKRKSHRPVFPIGNIMNR
jgi:hypothetical protein